MADYDKRVMELGITLPVAAAPIGNYVPYTVSGKLVFVSGQLPFENGKVAVQGRIGDTLGIDDGYRAGRICALNIIAQLKAACGGSLNKVNKVLRLGGFVCVAPTFADSAQVRKRRF